SIQATVMVFHCLQEFEIFIKVRTSFSCDRSVSWTCEFRSRHPGKRCLPIVRPRQSRLRRTQAALPRRRECNSLFLTARAWSKNNLARAMEHVMQIGDEHEKVRLP